MQHSKILYEKGILHNLKMLTQSQLSNYKFVVHLDEIKTLTAGLKSLGFGEIGSFTITEEGIRCTVETGKCIQASLFMSANCFAQFYNDGLCNFSINLNVLNECLAIYSGHDCSLKMFYKGSGAPLIIILEPNDEEDDITTECSIKTTHHEETIDFGLDDESGNLNVVIIRGPDLLSIFQEFDKSAEELEITLSPRKPNFKIVTLGVMQSESCIEVAKTSDMMILFNCREITTSRYKSSLLRMTLKALSVSTKVAIKTNTTGLLEFHFMMQDDTVAEVYVQFFIAPLVDSDL